VHISPAIKAKRHDEITQAVHAALLPGEQPQAVFAINRIRRAADYLALTDRRVLTWVRHGAPPTLVDDIDGASITGAFVGAHGAKYGKAEVVTRTGAVHLGAVLNAKVDELQYLEQLLNFLMTVPPTDELRAQRHAQLAAQVGEREAALATATGGDRKALVKEFRQADADAVLSQAQVFGDGKVTKPLLRAIIEMSHEGERPWFVLVSLGEGALVAFEDRAAVVKVGAVTALMAGAMGGGRVATFHFSDITGIEYNSGIMTGVLEVLTPSYQGTSNKDYWRGMHRSRNANADDPHTLSNTLPLAKATYRAALPGLNELRARIGRAKQPTVVVPASTAGAPASSLSDELARLGELHTAGVLTDEEFQSAKAALIARM